MCDRYSYLKLKKEIFNFFFQKIFFNFFSKRFFPKLFFSNFFLKKSFFRKCFFVFVVPKLFLAKIFCCCCWDKFEARGPLYTCWDSFVPAKITTNRVTSLYLCRWYYFTFCHITSLKYNFSWFRPYLSAALLAVITSTTSSWSFKWMENKTSKSSPCHDKVISIQKFGNTNAEHRIKQCRATFWSCALWVYIIESPS